MAPLDFTKLVQARIGVVADGDPGAKTMAALDAKLPAVVIPPDDSSKVDDRSEKNIITLLPPVQFLARSLIANAHANGIDIQVISGTRTYAEQDALYNQGRSKPGKIVTNARGGQSWHNHQVAFDIGVFKDGKYLDESPLYTKVGALGKALGLEWGGDWQTITDMPHFQLTNGKTLAQAQALHSQGKTVLA